MIRALALMLLALPAAAQEGQVQAQRYLCDRGVEVPATYVNAPGLSLAVIVVEGRQVTLHAEPAASGARYGWPSDAAGYVWWTKGPEATLSWREAGAERPLLEGCKAQE